LLLISPLPTSEEKDADPMESIQQGIAGMDDWTKEYINIAHLQPIQEAINDGGSGFINIHEVNTFTLGRPKEWT